MRWGKVALGAVAMTWAVAALADPGYEECMERAKNTADYKICGDAMLKRRETALASELKTRLVALEPKTKSLFAAEQRLWLAWKEKSCAAWQSGDFEALASATQFYPCREKIIDARISALTGLSQFGSE